MGRAATAKKLGAVPKALYDEPLATRRRIFRELREVGENVPDTIRYCTGCHHIPAHCTCGHPWDLSGKPQGHWVSQPAQHLCLDRVCTHTEGRWVPAESVD